MAGAKSQPVRIALLGCGTVGTGVVKLLRRHAANLERRLGAPLELVGIADRSLEPDKSIGITPALITRDSAELVARPEVDIVVELFGGIEPARKLMLQALAAGKDVVTGNKALLAEHGEELFAAANKTGLAIGFEASVGGGVPIIRTLREALAGDRQRAVYGIVNGTCNSILTTMTDNGAEFSTALKEAQATRPGRGRSDARYWRARRRAQALPPRYARVRRVAQTGAGLYRRHHQDHLSRYRVCARAGLCHQAAGDREG